MGPASVVVENMYEAVLPKKTSFFRCIVRWVAENAAAGSAASRQAAQQQGEDKTNCGMKEKTNRLLADTARKLTGQNAFCEARLPSLEVLPEDWAQIEVLSLALGMERQNEKCVLAARHGAAKSAAVLPNLLANRRDPWFKIPTTLFAVTEQAGPLCREGALVPREWAPLPQCWVPKLRNVLKHLPQEKHTRALPRQPGELPKPSGEAALEQLGGWVNRQDPVSSVSAPSLQKQAGGNGKRAPAASQRAASLHPGLIARTNVHPPRRTPTLLAKGEQHAKIVIPVAPCQYAAGASGSLRLAGAWSTAPDPENISKKPERAASCIEEAA